MTEHIVRSFDEALADLSLRVRDMCGDAERQYASASAALLNLDRGQAERALESDARLDALEGEIERSALEVLALRQPVAVDFRDAVSAVRIAAELERIGDLSKHLAKRALALLEVDGPAPPRCGGLRRMIDLVAHQLAEVSDAYAERDAGKAQAVWGADAEVDDWFHSAYRELLSYMLEDPRLIGACTHLLFAAKDVERLGDHCANVASQVNYLVLGEALPGSRPKGRDVVLDLPA